MDDGDVQLDAFSAVIERLHRAALGECDWLVAADGIRAYVGTDMANLLSVNRSLEITGGACSGLSDGDKAVYLRDWSHRDELAVVAFSAPPAHAQRFTAVISPTRLGDDSAYVAWYRPTGLVHGGFLHFRAPNQETAGFGLFNGAGRGPLTNGQLRATELIGHHLHGALRTAELIGALRQQVFDSDWLLRYWRIGLVHTDADARVQGMHGSAEALIRAGVGGLLIHNARLRVSEPNANRRLRHLIAEPSYGKSYSGPSLSLGNSGSGPALECIVRAVGESHVPSSPTAPLERSRQRLIVLRETGQPVGLDPHFLRQRLGLTPVEADVLARLMLGYRVEAIAEGRGSTLETIRGYLRALRRKLRCHSQGQLVHCGWQAVSFVPTGVCRGNPDM